MTDTLLLNIDGKPLSMLPLTAVTWKDAMRLMFLDKVRVVEQYEDWMVRTVSTAFNVPSVIMLNRYAKREMYAKFTRGNLYLRDNYTCQYCNHLRNYNELTYDHVVPISKGGMHNWSNVVASCGPCNNKKGNKISKPINDPYQPTYWDLVRNKLSIPIIIRHYSWERFITPGDGGFLLIKPSHTTHA